MAMFKKGLTAIRPNDHFILNEEKNVHVQGSIAQYLLNHQINGVRFLYRNYEKQNACILNDESGSGKCFQCIAFCDAILRQSNAIQILIICQQHRCLEHWQFHIDCFLENVRINVADHENDDSQNVCTANCITIASIDYVLNHLTMFTTKQMDCIIFQDQQLHTSVESFARLNDIKTNYKIILSSNDLMNDLGYFYELLKFCAQNGPLKRSKESGSILNLDEFLSKYGDKNDKTVSKRTQTFRQQILLNACTDIYMRRLCNQLGSQFPPISAEDFQNNFDAWKIINCDTVPLESQSVSDDFTPIELLPPPINRTLDTTADTTVANEEISILNVAQTNFSDFDTQMSPLIYSDSDESTTHDHSADIENSSSINSQRFTPDIVCNQEHAAKRLQKISKITERKVVRRQTTPVKRALRTIHDKISPNKRLNYKQLPIEIRSSSCARSLEKTYLFRSKKRNKTATSTAIADDESQSNRLRPISNTSDIEIISQAKQSPIVISTSSEDCPQQAQVTIDDRNVNEPVKEVSCPSPDLFTSFSSIKSDALSQKQSKIDNLCDNQEVASKSPLQNVFGAPDECDDIDLLSNTNVDIFEITKNSVFDNVLCSANDRITPCKDGTGNTATPVLSKSTPHPNVSCLSGLRIMFPNSDCSEIDETDCSLISSINRTSHQLSHDSSSDDVIVDLTALESQKIIEISSEDSIREVQKTPERKQPLTPSTRSCLKRHPANETNSNDERKPKTPRSKSNGWITAVKSASPKTDTPKSRRRLDKWKQRTDILNIQTTTKPRNLYNEFKPMTRADRATARRNMPSTSTAISPNIFSDNE